MGLVYWLLPSGFGFTEEASCVTNCSTQEDPEYFVGVELRHIQKTPEQDQPAPALQ